MRAVFFHTTSRMSLLGLCRKLQRENTKDFNIRLLVTKTWSSKEVMNNILLSEYRYKITRISHVILRLATKWQMRPAKTRISLAFRPF